MVKPNNLKELIKAIFYVDDSLRSKIKKDENVAKYMTEGLKEWITGVLKQN